MKGKALPEVVAIGAASLDIKGRPLELLSLGTSNPSTIRLSPGGAGRNIAENLARLGVRTILLTALGTDEIGRYIARVTAQAGVDMSQAMYLQDAPTGMYMAILDPEGLLHFSLDDLAILQHISPDYLESKHQYLRAARMVVLDANVPGPAMEAALSIAHDAGVRVCLNPVSVPRALRVKDYLPGFSIVLPNAAEAEALTGMPVAGLEDAAAAARWMVAQGLELAIVTMGVAGLVYADSEGQGHIPSIPTEIVDWTGAGDALAGAVVYGLINELPTDEAMRLGVSAATMTLSCPETVCPTLNLEQLYGQLVI